MKKTPSKSSKHLRASKSLTIQASLSFLLSLNGRDVSKTCCSDTFLSITVPLYDLFLFALNVNIMCFPGACVPTMFLKRYVLSWKAFASVWHLFFVDGRKYLWTGYQHRLGLYSSHLNITFTGHSKTKTGSSIQPNTHVTQSVILTPVFSKSPS